ncbi:hypothetical protein GF1_16350 [Desulfolithobacter dissulfuricans]|uniref:Conjugal transfer mating pair stabilization protein TraN n=2 Tax=Desulfolithobacter dissulfuricans TaxID=2795293 RepID=A0A915XHZ8_9BACT|nr:hypothetical protein GF1_16350 [Desulfolithobacter dissulfuricans]
MCEAAVFCSSGTYDQDENKCYEGNYTCPEGDYTCADIDGSGVNRCSSYPCVDINIPENIQENNADTSSYHNDGEIDPETGECEGMYIIFNGHGGECLKPGWDTIFFDCCDTEVDSFLFLEEACPEESIETAQAVAAGVTHYIGDYCKIDIPIIGCIQRAKMYCVFNSKMARIIHEQGRSQLQQFGRSGGWGTPEAPNCAGFTPEEFQMLDFSQIDLSEMFDEMVPATDMTQMQQDIEESIENYYNNIVY